MTPPAAASSVFPIRGEFARSVSPISRRGAESVSPNCRGFARSVSPISRRGAESLSPNCRGFARAVVAVLVVVLTMVSLTVIAQPPAADAQPRGVVFVAPNGNDANPGTKARPKATIAAAMRQLNGAGGEIRLRGGSYTITNNSGLLWQGGTARRPLVVRSAPGERARLRSAQGSHCVAAAADHIQIRRLTCTGWMGIAAFNSNHIVIAGNSVHDLAAPATQGILVSGQREDFRDVRVVRNRVTRVPHSGISVGDLRQNAARNVVIERNKVREANYQFRGQRTGAGGTGSGITVVGVDGARIVRNDVRRTYGNAINCALSNNCTVRRNVAVDAWNILFYGDNATNSVFEGNVAKTTGDRRFLRNWGHGDIPAQGFVFANESGWFEGSGRATSGNVVRNNVAIDVDTGFRFGEYQNGAAGMRDTVVAHNTFVGTSRCGIQIFDPPANQGNLVANNIVVPAGGSTAFCGGDRGTTLRNNLWASGRVDGGLRTGDVRAQPRFTRGTGLKASNYRLAPGSPGVDDGLSVAAVGDDLRGVQRPRGGRVDIGAYER